jgi:hypothetical protein
MTESFKFLQDFILQQGGTVAPEATLAEEQVIPTQITKPEFGQALEDTHAIHIDYNPRRDSPISKLTYFQDGVQRTLLVGHILYQNFHIPVHFSIVAAVILKRKNRKLTVWDKPLIKKSLIIPKQFVSDQDAFNLMPTDVTIVDIPTESPDYYEIKRLAFQASKTERLKCEEELIEKWLESAVGEDLLIIDGTIMNFRNEKAIEKCIGVSKSFRTIYCKLGEYQKILQLKEFERSWAFRFKEAGADPNMGMRDRISWYLRLRDKDGHNPEFGLVRLEVSLKHEGNIENMANDISKSIISERYPASFPDERWHNLIYPIKRCEIYLRSALPSTDSIRASVGRY